MAEFAKVVKERKRMCNTYISCAAGCPIGKMAQGRICSPWILDNPTQAEDAIMRWSELHPFFTNGAKFAEVFGEDLNLTDIEKVKAWLEAEYKGGLDG